MNKEQLRNYRAGAKRSVGTLWYHKNDADTSKWKKVGVIAPNGEIHIINLPSSQSVYHFLLGGDRT